MLYLEELAEEMEPSWYKFKEEDLLVVAKNWCEGNDVPYQRKGAKK